MKDLDSFSLEISTNSLDGNANESKHHESPRLDVADTYGLSTVQFTFMEREF